MAGMSIERVWELIDNSTIKDNITWEGKCHDCETEVKVNAIRKGDELQINGGSVYEPAADRFLVKCDHCHEKDPVLTNYQSCEVYSRVVGYLRPVTQWNDAKRAEFDDRKMYDSILGNNNSGL
ncbi:MAG: hypothetical protein HKM93_10215 [Desulfobacteraceae bacterium]|nr:hypothetical protein [Desulfobacteraceae bacterium]